MKTTTQKADSSTTQTQPDKATARPQELYQYELIDRNSVLQSCEAETLNEAAIIFGGLEIRECFKGFAVFGDNKNVYGVRWQAVQAVNEHAALVTVAKRAEELDELLEKVDFAKPTFVQVDGIRAARGWYREAKANLAAVRGESEGAK